MNQETLVSQVVISEKELERCVQRLAEEVTTSYKDSPSVLALVLMTGAKRFADDMFSQRIHHF